MLRTFKTWVPNVSGALSFSAIGSGCYPTQPIRANIGDQKERYLVAFQRRDLLDAVLPLIARKSGYRGDFVCLCVATSSDNPVQQGDVLKGRLFIFHDLAAWDVVVQPAVVAAQEKIRGFAALPAGNLTLFSHFQSAHAKLLSDLPGLSSFFVDFSLQRNGVTTLTIADDYQQRISPSAPTFPSDPNQRQHVERIVCSQLFFFLKDLCHNHQHHHPKADTLVDIHPFDGDEVRWRANILRVLYRKIIEFKRNSRPASFHSSLGVLIYSKSFRKCTFQELRTDIPPQIQDDLLETAINAGIQNTCITPNPNEGRNNLGFFITIGSFLLTVVMLLSLTEFKVKDPDDILKYLGELLVQKTAPLLAICYLIYLLRNMRFRGKYDLADYPASRIMVILLQPFDQKVAGYLLISFGVLMVIALTVFLVIWYPELLNYIRDYIHEL